MWYLVLSRSLPDQEENKQLHYEEHRQWLDDQHRAGRLLFWTDCRSRVRNLYYASVE